MVTATHYVNLGGRGVQLAALPCLHFSSSFVPSSYFFVLHVSYCDLLTHLHYLLPHPPFSDPVGQGKLCQIFPRIFLVSCLRTVDFGGDSVGFEHFVMLECVGVRFPLVF